MKAALLLSMLLLVPSGLASDPHECGFVPGAYACAGGGEEGDCASQGYRYDEVMLVTVAGYAFVRGDALCHAHGEARYEDDQVAAGAGTEVLAVGATWYRFTSQDPDNGDRAGCRLMPRVYSIAGPLVVENLECPAGQEPPEPGWGHLLP